MIKLLQYTFSVLLIGLSCQSVQAHRLDATETSIKLNPRTQHIEVIHKFYLHDVNHLVQQHFASNPDADKADKNEAFVEYILSSVDLKVGSLTKSLTQSLTKELTFIGAEEDGKFFYIYQEAYPESYDELQLIQLDLSEMQNSWKPSHWLFSVEIQPNDAKSFVLNKAEYKYQLEL